VERRLCDRRYHGGWSIGRLAADSSVDERTMRKRLQRIRDKLRKEIEMSEHASAGSAAIGGDLPKKIVELLARPQLTALPENPVGQITDLVRQCFLDLRAIELPEFVDLVEAQGSIADDAIYVDASEFHHIDERRILRYDLTLPLLLNLRYDGTPIRVWSEGKVYRQCATDATHIEAFHQAEVFLLDEHGAINPWDVAGQVLRSVDAVLPGSPVRIIPTRFPMCSAAWELEAECRGRKLEVLAWGIFTDRIVRYLGADPRRQTAIGIGYGIERLASLRYDIDDIRKVDAITLSA
jgi:phenylalanyl-tRNA synthetase alpha subunit